jgi:cytochrome c oxidase subunit 3
VIGVLFVMGQVLAWRQLSAAGWYLATAPSSSFFYILTALHAVHLAGGLIALGVVMVRTGPLVMRSFRALALYWHFMGALWLYLLLLLLIRL